MIFSWKCKEKISNVKNTPKILSYRYTYRRLDACKKHEYRRGQGKNIREYPHAETCPGFEPGISWSVVRRLTVGPTSQLMRIWLYKNLDYVLLDHKFFSYFIAIKFIFFLSLITISNSELIVHFWLNYRSFFIILNYLCMRQKK